MTHYPVILDENNTLDQMLEGRSIARFGDGEWRCATGGGCTSQHADPKLAYELRAVLKSQNDQFMVGLPNIYTGCPRLESWERYATPQFTALLNSKVYASSFITRPDNAPWIDTPDYWEKVRALWKGQGVILVVGNEKDGVGPEQKSITAQMMANEAILISQIIGPRQHAYSAISSLEKEIVEAHQAMLAARPEIKPRVLMCLGTCATVLAWRLSKRGIHALDVGHIGMFLRHAGAYKYDQKDLLSPGYRRQLEQLHKQQSWGADGAKHAQTVESIAAAMDAKTVLDYGCGEAKLEAALKPRRVSGYDPGIPARAKMPKPCDLVVCTDVLEHVEPDKLDGVLDHIFRLTARRAYVVISTKLANAVLPDGRNAHLIVKPAPWWTEKLTAQGWKINQSSDSGKELALTLDKP